MLINPILGQYDIESMFSQSQLRQCWVNLIINQYLVPLVKKGLERCKSN